MIRRFSAVLFVCLLLFSFSHGAVAQVYPDREELDVVRLIDGTVLKGVILEQVPDRYLEIELYGGSTFVLGYEQIESVEQKPNPDYGTTWIKVDLGGVTDPDDEEDTAAAASDSEVVQAGPTATDRKGRPFLGQGWMVGPYPSTGRTDFYGDDWDATLDAFDAAQSRFGGFFGLGVHAAYLVPFTSTGVRGSFWGGRGGLEIAFTDMGFESGPETAYGNDNLRYEISFRNLSLPFEGVIGYGGSRLLGYLGGGGGITLLLSEPERRSSQDSQLAEDNTFEFPESANPWQSFVQVSVGTLMRLGQQMTLDARAFWQWHLNSIFADTEQNIMITPGLSLGFVWHRKEA